MKIILAIGLTIILAAFQVQDRELMRIERSLISFVSDAPSERIAATNEKATGILDLQARTFAVLIPITDFQGFNSPLQREHFNENYMISRKFPNATFKGRVIEDVDLSAQGELTVRAKGEFTLKGVTRERIIPCRLVITEDGIQVTAAFDVLLDEHDIRVPRVVQQKISSVIQVDIEALFSAQLRAQ